MSMFDASDPSSTSLLPLCPTGSTQRERIDRPSTWSEDLGVIDNSSQAIHRVAVLALPLSQIFDLIFTFPLLKDLALNTYDGTSADNGDGSGRDEIPTATQPLTPTYVYRIPRPEFVGRDETVHPSAAVPRGWYPLPEAHCEVVSRRHPRVGSLSIIPGRASSCFSRLLGPPVLRQRSYW
jgi:hypothetical protein